jgi:hypothetical protein
MFIDLALHWVVAPNLNQISNSFYNPETKGFGTDVYVEFFTCLDPRNQFTEVVYIYREPS